MSALIISELIRILNDMEILFIKAIFNLPPSENLYIYLLNYFAEVLGISLKGVFHLSSSKSILFKIVGGLFTT